MIKPPEAVFSNAALHTLLFCRQGFASQKAIAGLDQGKKKEMIVQGLTAAGVGKLRPARSLIL